MKYNTTTLLEGLHSQTESNINKAITEWQQLSNTELVNQRGAGQWSAIQCLEHLNSYGRYYLPAMESAISKVGLSTPSQNFKSSWLGNYFYKSMLPAENGRPKKKMSSPKDHLPGPQLSATIVLSEFISQQEKLLQLVRLAQQVNISEAKVPISIAKFIKLQLGDTFLFFVAHINRHMLQAEKALQSYHSQHTGNGQQSSGTRLKNSIVFIL